MTEPGGPTGPSAVDRVYELMARAGELPYGETKTVLTEDALRHAEAAADPALAYQVRMELTGVYQYGGEPAKAFTTFSRCLSEHDRDPGRFGQGTRLLWHFKWIVNSLTLFPEVPLDRTYAVLDDMERRYVQGGHSLHAVYAYRHRVALHVGDAGQADEWYVKWNAARRDALSDCAGCDPSSRVTHLVWRGRHEDAIEVAAPVLKEEVDCTEQPQNILTALLPAYLRTGRLDEARDAHRRGYRLLRRNRADLGDIAYHLEFCAATGNQARGLEIVQRHLGWLDQPPTPYAAMRFATAAALILRRVEESGHGDLTVRRPGFGDRPQAEVPLGELRAELAGRAVELAARFDARNGTTEQGDLTRRRLDAEPAVDYLPLSAHSRAAAQYGQGLPQARVDAHAQAPTGAGAQPEAQGAAGTGPEAGTRPGGPAGPEQPTGDPAGLLDQAEEHWRRQSNSAAQAAWRRFDELTAGTDLAAGPAGRRADGRGYELLLAGDLEAGVAEWRRAARLHAEAGDETRRQSALSRIGAMLHADPDTADEGLALLHAAVSRLDEHAPGSRTALSSRLRLASALSRTDAAEQALDVLAEAAPGGDPLDEPDLDLARAQALARIPGREAEAVAALRRSQHGYRAAGAQVKLAEACLLLGRLLAATQPGDAHLGDAQPGEAQPDDVRPGDVRPGDMSVAEEILAAFGEAIANATMDLPELRSGAYATRGGWLLTLNRPEEAVADLVEAVAGFTATASHRHAAQARLDLAVAYLETGRHLDAAEVAEEAVSMLREFGDVPAERRGRFLLASALREFGEHEAAAETFAELAVEEEHPASSAELFEAAAELLTAMDKDGVAAERFADAAARHAAAGDPYGVVRGHRRRAMCLLWSGRPDAGLEAIGEARQRLADLPEANGPALTWETALVAYDAARIMAAAGRTSEALAEADRAVEGFTALGQTEAAQTAAAFRSEIAQAD